MNRIQLLLVVLVGFSSIEAFGFEPPPETTISVSISELFPIKTKKNARLKPQPEPTIPAGYGEQVAELLKSRKQSLMRCLSSQSGARTVYSTTLEISANGEALKIDGKLEGASTGGASFIEDCLRGKLSLLSFPRHALTANVIVRLPIVFEKEVL